MNEDTIKVLLVDDHEVVRRGIRALLETEDDIEVVGEAADGLAAVVETERLKPDVVLMDLVMPEVDGVEAIRRIRAARIDVSILVLTSFGTDDKLFPAIKAGALGYLLKDTHPAELVRAIREAYRGHSMLDPAVARRLLNEFSRYESTRLSPSLLTDRETDILRQVARGFSNDEIADVLHISEATVRTHVSHILTKLGLTNRTQAALFALREGLASIDDMKR